MKIKKIYSDILGLISTSKGYEDHPLGYLNSRIIPSLQRKSFYVSYHEDELFAFMNWIFISEKYAKKILKDKESSYVIPVEEYKTPVPSKYILFMEYHTLHPKPYKVIRQYIENLKKQYPDWNGTALLARSHREKIQIIEIKPSEK